MQHLIVRIVAVSCIVGVAGCQRLPAVAPTSAEVIDIHITQQPEGKLPPPAYPMLASEEESLLSTRAPNSYPAPQTYPFPQAYPAQESSYPYPGAIYPRIDEPYPGSGEGTGTLEPYIFETSQPGTATYRGHLIVMDPLVLLPHAEDAIFLVPLLNTEGGPSTIPPIDNENTLQAEVDERTGEFVFTNIKPGQYAIVVVTVGGSEIPARLYESGDLAIITVNETDLGKMIDLGYLSI